MSVYFNSELSLLNTVVLELEINSENFMIETIKLMSFLEPRMFLHQPIISVPWNLIDGNFQFVKENKIEILFSLTDEYFYKKFISVLQKQTIQKFEIKKINTYFHSGNYLKAHSHIDDIEKISDELIDEIIKNKLTVSQKLDVYFSEIGNDMYMTWLLQYQEGE